MKIGKRTGCELGDTSGTVDLVIDRGKVAGNMFDVKYQRKGTKNR